MRKTYVSMYRNIGKMAGSTSPGSSPSTTSCRCKPVSRTCHAIIRSRDRDSFIPPCACANGTRHRSDTVCQYVHYAYIGDSPVPRAVP